MSIYLPILFYRNENIFFSGEKALVCVCGRTLNGGEYLYLQYISGTKILVSAKRECFELYMKIMLHFLT